MARVTCNKELIQKAVALKKGGANNKDIAFACGVSESQFCRWTRHPKTENQEQLAQELKKAEAAYKNSLLAIIAKASKERDWKAAAWLLERKYPEEYSRREKVVLDNKVKEETAVPKFYFSREEAEK